MSGPAALSAQGLGKRYGSRWALQNCTLALPAGSVTALVGPNGAGKTTLLHLAIGLIAPSVGDVQVLGWSARRQPQLVLPRVGFVAQDHPLYRSFRLSEMLELGRRLNPRWDDEMARRRLAALGVELSQRAGTLSGGQQAQLALTLALAKRPELLVLDEPVASLDPLARREFLQSLMEAVADGGLTVILSSHILSELERVCDHLVILARGRVQLDGSIEAMLASHRLLTAGRGTPAPLGDAGAIIEQSRSERQTTMLARLDGAEPPDGWRADEVGLEEIVLAYLGRPAPQRDRGLEEVVS